MPDSDYELIQQCRCGNAAAFEALVRRWEGPVARLLVRLTGSPASGLSGDVDDLSQEVFLRVLSAVDRYRGNGCFSTWLYRIAMNVARDSYRRSRSRPAPLTVEPESTGTRAADEVVLRRQTSQLVAEALEALPAKLREPLVLKHFSELTFAETSRVLGLPESTVKSRVRSALLKLRHELARRGIDEREFES